MDPVRKRDARPQPSSGGRTRVSIGRGLVSGYRWARLVVLVRGCEVRTAYANSRAVSPERAAARAGFGPALGQRER